MKRFTPALALAAAFALGCSDTQPPTGPASVPPPRFAFSDGARSGNPDFFFLFPLGHFPRLSPNWDVGKAKTDKNTRIEICLLTIGANPQCETVIKQFSPDQITVVTPELLLGDESDDNEFPEFEPFYRAIWRTSQSNLNPDRFYRIRVLIGDFELGFADVDPVRTFSQWLRVDRTKYAGVIVGLPFAIRYRVEDGALCDVNTTCVEQFVEKEDGAFVADNPTNPTVYINIPADALPVDATITIEREAVPPDGTCEPTDEVQQQFEGCFKITSYPDLKSHGGFLKDVIVAFCVDPRVPEAVKRNLEMVKWDNGVAKRLKAAAASLDCENFQGTPAPDGGVIGWAERVLERFASRLGKVAGPRLLYASDGGLGGILDGARDRLPGDALSTFFWGLRSSISATSPQSQTGVVGSPVSTLPVVHVRMFHEHEDGEDHVHDWENAQVTFTVASGGGKLFEGETERGTQVQVSTNSDGRATLPAGWTWVLGSLNGGVNTMAATGSFGGSPVLFTATALDARVITFETYPDGGATCVSCPVTNQYVSQGVVFAFTPANPDVTATSPQLILAGNYDPVGSGANHSVTAAVEPGTTGVFIHGTVSLYFPHAPRSVQFRLRGNNDALNPFPVSAYSGPGSPLTASQITRSGVSRYTPGFDFPGREEIVTLTSPEGITRVDVHMTAPIGIAGTLIDNLLIGEVPSGIVNFEIDSEGEPICADGCDVTTAFAARGVTFSFAAAIDDGEPVTLKTNASICDGRHVDPLGFGPVNHLVTVPQQAAYPCGAGFAGTLTLTFDPAPTEVRFALRQRDGCSTGVNASGANGGDPFLSIGDVFHYKMSNGLTGEHVFTRVTHPEGIATINVTTSGCTPYLDNLVIITPT